LGKAMCTQKNELHAKKQFGYATGFVIHDGNLMKSVGKIKRTIQLSITLSYLSEHCLCMTSYIARIFSLFTGKTLFFASKYHQQV